MDNKVRKKDKKSKAITVKYSETEEKLLMKNFNIFNQKIEQKIKLRPYIRMLSLNVRLIKINNKSKVDNEMVRQLLSIGNNINQITRAINSNKINDTSEIEVDLKELKTMLTSISNIINKK